MKVLDRHVLREFGAAALVSFSFFTLLFLALHLFTHLSDFGEARAAFAERGYTLFTGMCTYYAMTLPFILVAAGPFALLMAGLWAAQRLAKDAETVAAQAAGVGLRRLVTPMIVAGALLGAFLGAARQEGLPRIAVERLRMERLLKGSTSAALTGTLLFVDDGGRRVLLGSFDPADRVARDVRIRAGDDFGRTAETPRMQYLNGAWTALDPVKGDAALISGLALHPREIEIEARGLRQMRWSELADMLERMPERRDLQVLKHARFAYPAGAVVLLVLGLALVLRSERRSVYAAAGMGLLLSVVYFAMESVLHGIAEREVWLPPIIAVWLCPVAFGGLAGFLISDL